MIGNPLTNILLSKDVSPPPLPPTKVFAPVTKKSRKMLYTVIAIAIIVVAVVAGTFLYMGTMGKAKVTSLKFNEHVTLPAASGGTAISEIVSVKNIATSNMLMLIQYTMGDVEYLNILDFAQQKMWMKTGNGGWNPTSSAADYNGLSQQWSEIWTHFQSRSGNSDINFTSTDGTIIALTNIQTNPSLSDTLFIHT